MIIDDRSYTTVTSTLFVENLGLPTLRYPQLYKLQQLTNNGYLKVTKQVEVEFSIGEYCHKVLCNMVRMQACHILVRCPRQYDRKAMYDELKNRYSFMWSGRKIILASLKAIEVY